MKEKINILDINKRSPLHWACALGNYDQAKIISKLGADISLTDVEGKTGLHWAATARCAEAAKLVKLLVNMKTAGTKTSVASLTRDDSHSQPLTTTVVVWKFFCFCRNMIWMLYWS